VRSIAAAVSLLAVTGAVVACSSSSPSPSASDDAAFCSLLLSFRAAADEVQAGMDSKDPAAAEAAITRLSGQVDELSRRAPDDIAADVDRAATFVRDLRDLLAEHGYDVDAIVADAQASEQFVEINSDEAQASLAQLRSYADADCAASGAPPTTIASGPS
jgi:hypothetical protein